MEILESSKNSKKGEATKDKPEGTWVTLFGHSTFTY